MRIGVIGKAEQGISQLINMFIDNKRSKHVPFGFMYEFNVSSEIYCLTISGERISGGCVRRLGEQRRGRPAAWQAAANATARRAVARPEKEMATGG
nr:hypothetical protein Itr_chr14CG10870 [Ipomoea trifida]